MLIILTCCLVLASVLILCVKRSRESFFLCGLSLSLLLEITGVMIFIAKKGGISPDLFPEITGGVHGFYSAFKGLMPIHPE